MYTVCLGSSDPPEKNIIIYLHQKMRVEYYSFTQQKNFRSHELDWKKLVRFNILGWVTTSWTYSIYRVNIYILTLIISLVAIKLFTSITMMIKPAVNCQIPATIHQGLSMLMAHKTPNSIATKNRVYKENDNVFNFVI